jgi:hypothetical protein
MRVTDNRYAGEQNRFDLAVRMIRHEARTGTIRACTGFSEDRIRKIYVTYFKNAAGRTPRRRRGKSPSQIEPLIRPPRRHAEATALACLFGQAGLFTIDAKGIAHQNPNFSKLETGQRLCEAYELYRALHPQPGLTMEWAWTLFRALIRAGELSFASCSLCSGYYVRDSYALDYRRCPFCDF